MSDLLFLGGALFILCLCFAGMIGALIYTLRELQHSQAPKILKWGLTSIAIAFGAMLLGLILKIMENL